MNKGNQELEDYVYLRHSAKKDESYFLTFVDDNGIHSVSLTSFEKNKITFGSGPNNDIILASNIIDYNQGYLELNDHGVLAVNTNLQVPMIGINNKYFDNIYLQEGSFIKYADPNTPNSASVLMVMSISKSLDEWKSFPLSVGNTTIGSGNSCDIVLTPNGVAQTHATIRRFMNKTTISDAYTINGTYVNGSKISNSNEVVLNNLDVIVIGNSKLILSGSTLYYQIFQRGIRLDVYDIVKNVKVKFKTRQIASHVNMQINPGEFVVFIGGSGAGKSTFMNCISGIDRPTSGKVFINGKDLYENYDSLKYNIGYVPQDDIVYSNLTLYDSLQYAAKLRMPDNTTKKERDIRIKEVLETVQLSGFENSYIRQLSGGQRKRASIAVELIADPNLFFLDEPTSGLDPGTERSLMHTLRQMSYMGKTIVLITHNTLNLHLCDKVAFFGPGGHLCFYGKPKEALEFFEVDDFVDIYNLISDNMEYWLEKFQQIQPPVKQPDFENTQNNLIPPKKKSFARQLINLISRNLKLIINDLQKLLILLAQAPVLAFLLSAVASPDLYSSHEDTKLVLFSMACSALWLGLFNSVQEISKEKVILKKEYISDLKLSAYLLSKFIVQSILAIIQSFVLIYVFQKLSGASQYSILINPFWDMVIICFISILSAAAQGLFISSFIKNTSVLSILPLILVPQLLLSGIFFKLDGILEFLSNFILCRWTVEGLGTSANLNALTHLAQTINPFIQMEPESYFLFTTGHMHQIVGVILLTIIVMLIGCYVALKRNMNKNM